MKILLLIVIIFSIAITTFIAYEYSRAFPDFDQVAEEGYAPVDTNITYSWVEYTAPSGRFSAEFPTVPQHAKDTVTKPVLKKYSMFVSEKVDGTLFMVNVVTFPNHSSRDNVNEIMTSVPNDMLLSDPENQLISMEQGTFYDLPAIDFKLANSRYTINGKTFMTGKTLYILSRRINKDALDEGDYKKFVDSFKLLDQEKPE